MAFKEEPILQFRPIDLLRHSQICLRFEIDMEACSYGGDGSPDAARGAAFLRKIAAKSADDPQSCLHVWRDDVIVGQLHLGRVADEPIGYIHMFYVAPAWRGTGIASQLDDYAIQRFSERDFRSARLSVTTCNERALRFYQRQGWRDGENRADKPGAIFMNREWE